MIRCGDTKSIPKMKRLWKECFADADAYINAFFEALYEDKDVLLAEAGGVFLGASFFLPGKIYLDGNWQDIRYVYALAVCPQFRGRGTAGRLLKAAFEHYHAPLIAEPADEGLAEGFYAPLGFSRAFYLAQHSFQIKQKPAGMPQPRYHMQAAEVRAAREDALETYIIKEQNSQICPAGGMFGTDTAKVQDYQVCPAGGMFATDTAKVQDYQVRPADAETYCRIREMHFRKQGCVHWPAQHVAFAIAAHCREGGEALCITKAGREDILLYYIEDGQIVVTETTLPQEEAAAVLWKRFERRSGRCSRIVVKKAAECTGQAQSSIMTEKLDAGCRLTGMAYGLAEVYGYLNLSLD